MHRILGHEQQRIMLARLWASKALPSALLFTGPPGVGKSLVAEEAAQSLFCDRAADPAVQHYGGCGSCKTCHLFEAGNLPDYYRLDCSDREHASIQQVRDLLYSLSLTAFGGRAKVVVFDNAEQLSDQAANTLLKSVEEPRAGTYFILVTANHSKLPATLVSRCQPWFFDTLPLAAVTEALEARRAELPEDVSVQELALLADGSLGNVQDLIAHCEQFRSIRERLRQVRAGDIKTAVDLAAELGKSRDGLRTVFQLLRIIAREEMSTAEDRDGQAHWAAFLTDVIKAERLIFERNLSAVYLLNVVLLALSPLQPLPGLTYNSSSMDGM